MQILTFKSFCDKQIVCVHLKFLLACRVEASKTQKCKNIDAQLTFHVYCSKPPNTFLHKFQNQTNKPINISSNGGASRVEASKARKFKKIDAHIEIYIAVNKLVQVTLQFFCF